MNRNAPLYLFLLLIVLSPMAIDIYLSAFPEIAGSLSTSMGSVQATIAIFLTAMGVGQLVAGPLADRYGRRPLALGGILLYMAGALLAALASQIEVLWAARVLQGLGTCGISVAVMSGVRDSYPADKTAPVYSYINGVICVIPALAPMLGGFLTQHWGWQANFYFMLGYAGLIGSLVWWRLPETRPASTVSEGALISVARFRPVLANRVFRYNAIMVMLAMAVIIGFVTLAPIRLMLDMQISAMTFSLWFGSNAVINILASFTAPWVIRRLGKKNALRLAVSLCALAASLLMLLSELMHPMAFMGPVFLASTGFCLTLAICSGAALAPFGERAGTASSLLGVLQMAGSSALVGLISSLPLTPVMSLALLMALPLVWMMLSHTRQRLQPASVNA